MDNDKFGLRLFDKQPAEDLIFTQFWMQLQESEELKDLVRPDRTTLLDFLELIRPPRICLYSLGTNSKVDYFAVLEAASNVKEETTLMIGALWADTKLRGRRLFFRRLNYMFERIYERYDHCFITTWSSKSRTTFQKFGFSVVGFYPVIYNIPNIYSLWMTKDEYFQTKTHKIFSKR